MATTLEIIQGINQAAANAYDGAHDEKYSYDGEARKVGLFREEGDVITDSRIMDGFGVRFQGNRLIVSYQYDCMLKHVHENGFESEIESNDELNRFTHTVSSQDFRSFCFLSVFLSKIVQLKFFCEITTYTSRLLSFDKFFSNMVLIIDFNSNFLLEAGQILERSQWIQIL